MYTLFVKLLSMSAMGGALAAVIIVLRLFLKKWPRKYICILWALVAIRLICPVSISSFLSAYNVLYGHTYTTEDTGYLQHHGTGDEQEAAVDIPMPAGSNQVQESGTGKAHRPDLYQSELILLWVAGIVAMLLYAAICYRNLRKETSASIRIDRSIYICDNLRSPFILGVARPRIYLPSGLDEETRKYVIAHEKAHLKRLDYLWKPLGYVVLTLHWFNPLIWIAYILFCRDIEVSCDERVLADLDREGAIGYAGALLSLASGRRHILACPVAFGEYGVKARVKNILSYKKPAVWAGLAMIVVCLVCAVCFLTDPKGEDTKKAEAADPRAETAATGFSQQSSEAEGVVRVLSDSTTELFGLNRCELPAEGTIYVYEEPFIRGTEKEIDKLGQGDTAYVTAVRRISWQDQNGLDYEELALRVAFVRDGKTVTGWVMDNLLPEPVFELKDGAKYYYYEENDRKLTEHIYQRAADEQGSHSPWEVIAFSDEEGMWKLTGTGGSEIYVEDLSVLEEKERTDPALDPSPLPAG